MKILMISDFYGEGLTYQENILSKKFLELGHEVEIITSTFTSVFDYYKHKYTHKEYQKYRLKDGSVIHRVPYKINILNRIRKFLSIENILQKFNPDIILIHDITLNTDDIISYKLNNSNSKIYLDYHADFSNSGKNALSIYILHKLIRKYYLNKLIPYLNAIYPVTPGSEEFLRKVYSLNHSKIRLLPLGVDLEFFRKRKLLGVRSKVRKSHGFTDCDLVIFTGGKLSRQKKTDALIKSFILANNSNIKLIIIGESDEDNSDYLNYLRNISCKNPNIFFTGWLNQEETTDYLLASDLAIFPASQSVLWQQAIGAGLPLFIGEPLARKGYSQDVSYMNLKNNIKLIVSDTNFINLMSTEINIIEKNRSDLISMSHGAIYVAENLLDWDKIISNLLLKKESHL